MKIKCGNLLIETDLIAMIECVEKGEYLDHPIKGAGQGEREPDNLQITLTIKDNDGNLIEYEDVMGDFDEICKQIQGF